MVAGAGAQNLYIFIRMFYDISCSLTPGGASDLLGGALTRGPRVGVGLGGGARCASSASRGDEMTNENETDDRRTDEHRHQSTARTSAFTRTRTRSHRRSHIYTIYTYANTLFSGCHICCWLLADLYLYLYLYPSSARTTAAKERVLSALACVREADRLFPLPGQHWPCCIALHRKMLGGCEPAALRRSSTLSLPWFPPRFRRAPNSPQLTVRLRAGHRGWLGTASHSMPVSGRVLTLP
jgi:hypothetical protein